jgi:hypothetical protein
MSGVHARMIKPKTESVFPVGFRVSLPTVPRTAIIRKVNTQDGENNGASESILTAFSNR